MTINPNKIRDFIDKTFSIKQNAVWNGHNYTELVMSAASHNTYLETMNSNNMPNADTLHYRIAEDTTVMSLLENFLKPARKQLKRLKKRKAILIIDYTYEPFYGRKRGIWIHEYKPVKGCNGCYKILSASIVVDEERYFIYAKPVSIFADGSIELIQIMDYIETLGIRIRVVLLDRGLARSSGNLRVLKAYNLKFLGLYPKYRNVKRVISTTKKSLLNRKFDVRGISARLVIGKNIGKKELTWVFVTTLEFKDFFRYLRLYKKRWNIETGFRVQDEACIKTKSLDIRVRYFLFLVAMLLYNVWKSLLGRIAVSFKKFVINLWGVKIDETKPT
ncbi:MAG: transposase [Candidatus Aenigmarchaeota archaeon]|nr:transposase [Candidatus Aenigmarchaeota archaeon]